ncbi:hypothetical protein ACFC96_12460 [Streptomyces sp. NPDC055955]|uniref:hypothetical protein n=1 Tax=Streptomyces sp. NPDC055955 TaxID=3345665 RepID=UPI0035DEBE34
MHFVCWALFFFCIWLVLRIRYRAREAFDRVRTAVPPLDGTRRGLGEVVTALLENPDAELLTIRADVTMRSRSRQEIAEILREHGQSLAEALLPSVTAAVRAAGREFVSDPAAAALQVLRSPVHLCLPRRASQVNCLARRAPLPGLVVPMASDPKEFWLL